MNTMASLRAVQLQKAIELVEHFLPLNQYGFKQSVQFLDNAIFPIVIYDSEKCRIRVFYDPFQRYEEDHLITVHYGSLEVPDNAIVFHRWEDQKNDRLYWHSDRLALYFLDGLSPQEAKNAKHPRLFKEFDQSEEAKKIMYWPERNLIMHATIWETYGQRLFDIFDSHNKDLWEQYSEFAREYWKTLTQI